MATQLTSKDIQAAIDMKTKPVGSLGRIEKLAAQIAGFQNTLTPRLETCGLILFAGDHGIAREGVSNYPQAVTRQMVQNFLTGGAAANVFARTNDVQVRVVDTGVYGEPIEHPGLISRRLGDGTENSAQKPAMSKPQLDMALASGAQLAGDGDFDALCFGEMGIGNTSAATLILSKITDESLKSLTGRGTGLDDEGLRRKLSILERAAKRTPDRLSVEDALLEYGGFEIATMAGAMIGAAKKGRMVLVDGFIATCAAYCAQRMDVSSRDAMIFTHVSNEAGHRLVCQTMYVEPLLDLGLRLGEGTGALLAWPIVKSAAAMLRDMASFSDAGVSGPA